MEVNLAQVNSGGDVSVRRATYVKMEKKLVEKTNLYTEGNLSRDDFLDQVGVLLKLQA